MEYDFFGILYEPFWMKLWFLVPSILLILFTILFVIFIFVKRFFIKKEVAFIWDKAFKDLELLKNIDSSEVFYTELTGILKGYIETMYGMIFKSKTDFEVLNSFKKDDLQNKSFQSLGEIFKKASDAKFSNLKVSKETMMNDLSISIGFIESSIPKNSNEI